MLGTLLRKRVSTYNILVRQQVDVTLEKLIQHSNAFQSVTVVRPLSQMCRVLDGMVGDSMSDRGLEAVLEFIEQSFSRFMQSPYPFLDEAVSLHSQGERIDIFSSVLVTCARQWIYLRTKESMVNLTDLTLITEWFYHVLIRLVIVGENSRAILKLLEIIDKNCIEGNERISRLRDDILRWVLTSSNGNNTVEISLPGDR